MRIVLWNGAAERMFGWDSAEAVGRELSLIVPPELWHETQSNTKLMQQGMAPPPFETVRLAKFGRRLDVQIGLSGIYDKDGHLSTVAGIFRDITERKRAEVALRQSEQRFRQLNEELERKVAARTAALDATNRELEAFSYSVSHDLRAPLRSIDGFSQALLEDYADKLDADGKGHLQRVRASTQRMGALIDDLLNLSRVTRGEMRSEPVDLTGMAQALAAELKKSAPDREVEFVIADGLSAQGDPRLLRIVIDNLLGNAWKYTSKHPRARIEFGFAQNNGHSAYFVRDDGAGFDMAYADKLFGAFQRLHRQAEFSGTGIGLATVQRIMHRHGGRVWAEGEVEKGATFYFTLST
jgi:PAS domain S-box-containing protein